MRILVKKISAICLVAVSAAVAQDTVPVAPAEAENKPAEQPATQKDTPKAATPGKAAAPVGTDTSAALDYLYNRKPQDGSAGKQALEANQRTQEKAVAEDAVDAPKNDDPAMKARYERFLGTAEVPQEEIQEYSARLKLVSNALRENKPFDAWKLLSSLAQYDSIDGGISQDLANRVESVWNTGRANSNIDRNNEQMRRDVKSANSNADMLSETVLQKELEYNRKLNKGGQQQQKWQRDRQPQGNGVLPQAPQDAPAANPQSVAGLEGKLRLTEEYLKSLELKAKIKVNELKQQKLLDQAKADFAEYITTLYEAGRFNHVVIAADFFRKVFEEGEYPASMAKTVNASLEADRSIQSAVEVVGYKTDRNQLVAANASLQEAFAMSERNLALLGVKRPLKEKIADFNANLEQMKNLIEARDFGELQNLIDKIKQTAVDFDTTKPMAIVNAVKLESRMRLGKAKLLAQQGDQKGALDEFQAAAQIWPGNPDLEDKALTFFDAQDIKSQTLVEFDRLIKEQNYRAVFEKQLAFAPAIAGDAKREESLKNALLAIKNAETASEKANVMMMAGDSFGAWEAVELASIDLPDDKKLNKLRADLSGRSAEFVAAINKARDAEARGDEGFSLTWYVNAQRQYPASKIANDGIERLSKKLLQASL
jgi:hypothetical protein